MNLEECRKQIDEIDRELTRLFEERMALVVDVARTKKRDGLPILQSDREAQVIQKNQDRLKNQQLRSELGELYTTLMSISKQYQRRLIEDRCVVGYQGVDGSFSSIAAKALFMDEISEGLVDMKNYKEFEDVFIALKEGEIRYGVVPIENSSTGVINQNYDFLYTYDCHILGENSVRAEQNLLAPSGATLETIKEVYSHPQGFEQSVKFLSQYKDWELIPHYNTAISAQHVSEQNDPTKAAIASKEAARVYGLQVLAEDICDNKRNYTRMIKIGRDLEYDERCNRISVVFAVVNKAGTLFRALEAVGKNNINMINLESRPVQNRPWEYLFYLDIEGNLTEKPVIDALDYIEKQSNYYKLLGCYRREAF